MTQEQSRPKIGTVWEHTNGCPYIVRGFTNTHSTNPKYPETVIYEGAGSRMWSRPLADWHRSMTDTSEQPAAEEGVHCTAHVDYDPSSRKAP